MSPIKIKDGATAHLIIKYHPNIEHLVKPNQNTQLWYTRLIQTKNEEFQKVTLQTTTININPIQFDFKYDTRDLPKLNRSPTRDGNSYQIGINAEKYIWKEHQTNIMVLIVPKSQTYHDSWTFNMKDNYL